MNNLCQFSPCRSYRYTLEHAMEPLLPSRLIMWIGLNPSTADENKLDHTLTRIARFSRDAGYTGFVMTNLFAFRATDPAVMKAHPAPFGPDNDRWLQATAARCERIVACWGNHGTHMDACKRVFSVLAGHDLCCLGTTGDGFPKHPLARGKAFIPYGTEFAPYNLAA